jgi:hypothetical protein
MVQHLKDAHTLLLLGEDEAGVGWESASSSVNLSDDYIDNPSVLRYILEKGITDAGGNPFDGVSAYNPEDELVVMQEELNDFITSVGGLDPDADVVSFLDQADTSAEGDLGTLDVDSAINSVVSKARLQASQIVAEAIASAGTLGNTAIRDRARKGFEARVRRDHLAAMGEFTGPMSDVGAVNTSAFVIGLAKLQRGLDDRLAQFDTEFILPNNQMGVQAFMDAFRTVAQQHLQTKAQVHVQEAQLKNQYILEATRLMTDQNRLRVASEQSLVDLQKQVSSAAIVAYNDEYGQNLDIDVKGQNWDLELFQQGANVLSAVSGSVVSTAAKPSRVSSGLSGALGGAGTGAALGTQIGAAGGPIGTAGGAAIGTAVGLVAGLTA